MKKFFTFLFSSSLLFASQTIKAQSQVYWNEGFENTTGNLNSNSALAPTTPAVDTADNGIWVLFQAYRSSTSPAPCPAFGAPHIRLAKVTGSPWAATPDLGFGVNTVSIGSNTTTTGKVYTLQYTIGLFSDQDAAGVAAAPWVTFAKFKIAACGDTTVTLNNPLARRIRFINDTAIAYQADFDSIVISSTSTIVPVKFSGINANYNNGIVKISWSNESEINASAYSIERSADGKNFSPIGSVKATNVRSYGWYDNTPTSGFNYYRIKSIDNNGRLTYSTIVKISSANSIQGIVAAPNPVTGHNLTLQLNNLAKGSYTVNIYNSGSQKVYSSSVSHNGGNSVQSLTLPASVTKGLYNVNVRSGATSFNKTIIVE